MFPNDEGTELRFQGVFWLIMEKKNKELIQVLCSFLRGVARSCHTWQMLLSLLRMEKTLLNLTELNKEPC